MNEPSVHIGRVAFDFEILRTRTDPPQLLLRQSRGGEVHQLTMDTAAGADMVAALLEAVSTAHPSFFDREIRPMFQRILDELQRYEQRGGR